MRSDASSRSCSAGLLRDSLHCASSLLELEDAELNAE